MQKDVASDTPPPATNREKGLTAFSVLAASLPAANIGRFKGTFDKAVAVVRSLSTVVGGYVRPTASRRAHPFTQHGFPEVARDKLSDLPGEILSKLEFFERACARASPYVDADTAAAQMLDPDLIAAIDAICEMGPAMPRKREQRMLTLRRVVASLEGMRAALDACKSPEAAEVAGEFNVAWAAVVIDAIEWEDVMLPLRYVTGYAVVFNIPDTHVFRSNEQPASISREKFLANNTRAVASISREIERSARLGDADEQERRWQAWKRTREEIDAGLVREPMTRAQVDRKRGRGKWRCLGRSAIWQKGKYRCIDNGKRSKHNRATHMHESITCGRADFPVTVSREFARRKAGIQKRRLRRNNLPPRFRMRHGCGDLFAAYRRSPTSQPEYTIVAVYCYEVEPPAVRYCEVPGHNFGLCSAVNNFNGYPELATAVARRVLWIVTEHYVDDSNVTEPDFCRGTGLLYLMELSGDTFFGFRYDDEQTKGEADANEYLGVWSDLDGFNDGVMSMDVTAKRRGKLGALLGEVRRARTLRSGLASSIFGKARFMLSPVYGCIGKACLQPIKARERQPLASALDADLSDSVEFLEYACEHLPPMHIPVLPPDEGKVVVFVDAEGKKRKGSRAPTGHIGFVVEHPTLGRRHGYAPVPPSLTRLLDATRLRDTYIGQYEMVGAIVPFLSLPREWFAGRPVELWIDNTMAIGALLKGYSGKPDTARIVNMFHFTIATLGAASLWIDYVNSESNLADTPSRFHEMSEADIAAALADLGSPTGAVIPRFADDGGNWLPFVDIARSVWG